jgi:hypothetical protein
VSGEKTDDEAIGGHPPPKPHHFSPVTGRPRRVLIVHAGISFAIRDC